MLILFDFDGTLADTYKLGTKLINEYADKFGYQRINFEQNKDKSAKELIKISGVKFWKIPHLLRFFRNQTVKNADEIEAFTDIPQLIKKLYQLNYTLGIVTTNTKRIIEIFINKYQLNNCFTYYKTDVSLFGKKRALKQAKRKNKHQQIIYVGDELRDIEAASKANIPIISTAWGFNSATILKQNNNCVVSNCTELEEAIFRTTQNKKI